jgi:hypothetical protein
MDRQSFRPFINVSVVSLRLARLSLNVLRYAASAILMQEFDRLVSFSDGAEAFK